MNQTGSMGALRKNNTRNKILYIIRKNDRISKTDIKKISRYSMSTALGTIDKLVKDKILLSTYEETTRKGRPPTYISLNPDAMYFIGLAFHATEISLVVLDFCGNATDFVSEKLQNPISAQNVIEKVTAALKKYLSDHAGIRHKIAGIGLGSPGFINRSSGISLFYEHIPGWNSIDIRGILEQEIGDIPVYIENNTNGIALAYKWLFPEMYKMTCVIISIRSGMRMSLLVNSAVYEGDDYSSGEIGHIPVKGSKRYCPCGKRGCLEIEIAEIGLKKKIMEGIRSNSFKDIWEAADHNTNNVTTDLFLHSVKQGQDDAVQLLEEICEYLGDSITQIVNILNPNKVIISSRYCELESLFFDPLIRKIKATAVNMSLKSLTIEPVVFGEKSLAIGAASIVMEEELKFVDAAI